MTGYSFPAKYGIITNNHKVHKVFALMEKVMDSPEPVLIQGESGTGKELVARALHFHSRRKDNVFLAENCAAISDTLLESELFGYTKGAFTGADKYKKGLFELACGGTIFLDEIGDISAELQKKLLRVLQEGEFRKVGGESIVHIKDTRIITATNKNLRQLCKTGQFRDDLFYRLNVITIHLPPLRERREDILLLSKYFLSYLSSNAHKIEITDEAREAMTKYDWPGNIRELENEIKKAILLNNSKICLDNLSENLKNTITNKINLENIEGRSLKEMVQAVVSDVESRIIVNRLNKSKWNKTKVARELGLSRETLRLKIIKYNLDRRK